MAGFFNRIMSKFQTYDQDMVDETYDQYETDEGVQYHEPNPNVHRQARVVDFKASTNQGHSGAGQQVVAIKPDSMEAAQEICHHLRSGRTVICNFEQVDPKVAQRVVDFITGSAYALDGKVHPVTSLIFVLCPRSVTFMNNRDQQDYNTKSYAPRQAYGM